jgi:hypothetical protein
MKASEIIAADAEQRGLDPNAILSVIYKMVQEKNGKLMQSGDSVLFLEDIGDKNVALHLFTEDKPLALAKAVVVFMQQIRGMDLDAVYGNADNQQIIQLLTSVGVPVQQSDKPEYNWMAMV